MADHNSSTSTSTNWYSRMLYLVVLLGVIIIIGALLIRGALLIMSQRAGKFLSETHGAIEYIHAAGAVPPQWLAPFQEKIRHLNPADPDYQRRLERIIRAARHTCRQKLNKLYKYVYRSSLIQDEEARIILLKKLTDVQEKWAEQDWSDIIGS